MTHMLPGPLAAGPRILDLAAADDTALVGGKAASLGRLIRAGFPVPPGSCVTTVAYRAVADPVVGPLLDEGAAPAALRAAVRAAPVPAELAAAIRALADGLVAVRSSATAEDLPDASFAGQQDTFLDVEGPEAVLDAVRRCWASLWTDRAVAYRAAHGIDGRTVALAVVVQRMVPAAAAGVLFTANPVTGRRAETVIEAAPGLGEAVVSGAVDPEHVVLDASGRVVERRAGGVGPALSDARARELADLGRRVAEHHGGPQDLEWAVDGAERVWLVQARPVTTLYPLPEDPAPGLRIYLNVNVAQGVLGPLTTVGQGAFRVMTGSMARLWGIAVPDLRAGAPVLTVAGERLLVDVTGALRHPVGRVVILRLVDVMETRSATVLRRVLADPAFAVLRRRRLRFARALARVLTRFRMPPRMGTALLAPGRSRRGVEAAVADLRDRLGARPPLPAAGRLDRIEATLAGEPPAVIARVLPVAGAGFVAFGLAAALLRGRARPGELSTVLRGLPHNVTTEMDLDLWRLAGRIATDPPSTALVTGPADAARRALEAGSAPAVLAEGLRDFLARYGHRAVAEIDLGVPRWREDPSYLLGVLAGYLRADPDRTPDRVFAAAAAEARRTTEVLAARAGGLRGRAVRLLLCRARALAGLRELPKFALVAILDAARTDLLAVGEVLAEAGRIAAARDVVHLTTDDCRAGLAGADLRALVVTRRAAYDRERRRRHVPRILLSDGTEPEAVPDPDAPPVARGELRGTPASAGVVEGPARVVSDPADARLEPGEILVCPSTDPGWTPLFLTAAGLVMEMGGTNSHGAVVAREYGIPAVVGVPGAVARIATGRRVVVDGTAGRVRPG
ncbi:phosphoenolpyruvate synthase [Pseudonocardia sp. RS11V-5]|uniref:PEP/pyruvate-binding domain-containing protein n=1 Tax=Pseudonocardia terrae TaxID=2905831 RepID=UPI001E5EA01C|nr:PEP/pyruvate-binding domain-containing protein [Pseudonocardia terrae]MCE3550076.1 phosphoenolpyruvate synthase [Pseudonocardia terrae]